MNQCLYFWRTLSFRSLQMVTADINKLTNLFLCSVQLGVLIDDLCFAAAAAVLRTRGRRRSALTAGWLRRFFTRRCCYCHFRCRRRRSPQHAASCRPDTNCQELDLRFYKRKHENYAGKVCLLVWRRVPPSELPSLPRPTDCRWR